MKDIEPAMQCGHPRIVLPLISLVNTILPDDICQPHCIIIYATPMATDSSCQHYL